MRRMIISVVIMALVTYVIRALPVTIINKEVKSKYIKSFLFYVPYAVLASMTFPSILYSTGNVISSAVGTGVAIVLAYFRKGLVIVALGAMAAAFICGFVPFLT